MKYDCEVIRDLLPLYADRACSERSRTMVEEHLQECPDCRRMVSMLLDTRIENELQTERESVLDYGARQFRRRTAIVGSAADFVNVSRLASVVCDEADFVREFVVCGEERATVAVAAERLGRVKARDGNVTERAGGYAVLHSPERLG